MSTHAPSPVLQELDREAVLDARLQHHGQPSILRGDTTTAQRKARAREYIGKVGSSTLATKRDGKPITYATLFQLVYGEPL